MPNLDTLEKSNNNFETLEGKLKSSIAKCSNKTLVETYDSPSYTFGVKNAVSAEHHVLENGLHVYKFSSENQPICYWMSNDPLYKNLEYNGLDGKKRTRQVLTGAPGIEYAVGGVGNSLPLNLDRYTSTRHISLITSFDQRRMDTDLVAAPGFALTGSDFPHFSSFSYLRQDYDYLNRTGKNQEAFDSGDLEGLLRNIKPSSDSDRAILGSIVSTFDKVDQLSLKKDNASEKRGFLKSLLGRNKELDKELDPFKAERRK